MVEFASQVLSLSDAAGISLMVSLRVLSDKASETAFYVGCIDQLFNAFNSLSKISSHTMHDAISEKLGHTEFLYETLSWTLTLKGNLLCMINKLLYKVCFNSAMIFAKRIRLNYSTSAD